MFADFAELAALVVPEDEPGVQAAYFVAYFAAVDAAAGVAWE